MTRELPLVGGQVKTFHHAVYAGILARRDVPAQLEELREQGIGLIDLVVVNVKPFAPAIGAKLVGGDLDRFVHRIADGTVAQPYRAVLTLGSLAGERTIVAIGQSRHLGGGLLVPLDVPLEGTVAPGTAS